MIDCTRGPISHTAFEVVKGAVRLGDRVIFALIAVAVLSKVNKGQVVPNEYFLTFGESEKMLINDWWGRESDFSALVAKVRLPKVKLDFGDWMY